MHPTQHTLFSRRHLVWLLWLVLLLPMAQTAATWHVLSHVNSEQREDTDGQKAIHQGHCDLCLSAAALVGGAPVASSPALPAVKVMHELTVADVRSISLSTAPRAYDSRAPPFPQP
jgi:hypothetical protein